MLRPIPFASLILFVVGSIATGSPETQCADDEFFVRSHPRRAYYRANGTHVRASQVSGSCRRKSKGHDFWIKRIKSGKPPGWPHRTERTARWTDEERTRVLEALAELPDEILDPSIEGIYRLKQSKDRLNPSAYGGSMIVLYDSAFNENRTLARLLAHELAHHKYEGFRWKADGVSYRKATGWRLTDEGDQYFWTGRMTGYVEDDGKADPKEDFANNIEHFLFNPNGLKSTTPTAYQWIKWRFGDNFVLDVRNK